jgi:hypothetical protein
MRRFGINRLSRDVRYGRGHLTNSDRRLLSRANFKNDRRQRSDITRYLEVRAKRSIRKPVTAQGPQHSAKSFSSGRYTIKDTNIEFVFRDHHLVREEGVSR